MYGKDTTKSTFDQLFEAVTSFTQNLKNREVDKYIKKFTLLKFILLMSFAQLNQLKSLRDISSTLDEEKLSESLELISISAAQISRKLRADRLEAIQALFAEMIHQVGINQGFQRIRQELGQLYLIDSTVISLCFSQYRWADFRKTKSGIKLHTRIKLLDDNILPDKAVMTVARKADRTQMDELVVEEKDAFNVFDRAYLDYEKFDYYCEQNIRFASRLKSNALVKTLEEYPLGEGTLISDSKVILGKKNLTQMKNALRIIKTTDSQGKIITIVTNDFSLSAQEIADIYRYRWQIEVFFKWIKQHLHVKHFFGTGEQAVELQLYIALITYCLLTLIRQKTGYTGTLLALKRCLCACLYEPFPCFVKKLYGKGKRQSRGRRKVDYESIYQETIKQVIAGEADHLDDLTYDPVVL
jgi:hypothetical protein